MRILLDTNILISGVLIKNGMPAKLVDLWLERKLELVTSQLQIDEVQGVLARPKIAGRIAPGEAEHLLENLEKEAIWVADLPVVNVSPDSDDNLILATAIAGKAALIVSGDRVGMLDLKAVSGIPIVSAREAVERLGLGDDK